MRVTFECPDAWSKEILEAAKEDGHDNASAVCRKALSFFLFSGYRKVEKKARKSSAETKKA